MFWITPKIMDRKQGDPSTAVLLADKSASMNKMALVHMDQVIPAFRKAIPGLRVFAFHADVKEVRYDWFYNFMSTNPDVGIPGVDPDAILDIPYDEWDRIERRYGGRNTTYLGSGLEKIAALSPQKTIVITDGSVADQKRVLNIADRMTGDIDAYFCNSYDPKHEDIPFMRELARRGRGRFVHLQPDQSAIRRELRQSLQVQIGYRVREVHKEPEWLPPVGGPVSASVRVAPAVVRKFTKS